MSDKFKVGQKVWFIGSIFYKNEGLVEGEISKVGRKYIYVTKGKQSCREVKFCKKSLVEATETGTRAQLYLSKQEYMDKVELSSNIGLIRKYFPSWDCEVSLDKTRKILAVLEDRRNDPYESS